MLFDIRKTLWFSKLMFVLQQLDFPLILFTSILFNGPQVLPLGKTLPALKVEEKDSISRQENSLCHACGKKRVQTYHFAITVLENMLWKKKRTIPVFYLF